MHTSVWLVCGHRLCLASSVSWLAPSPLPTPEGFDSTALVAHLPQLTSGLGSLLRVPAACVSLSRITDVGTSASGQRRLLAQR